MNLAHSKDVKELKAALAQAGIAVDSVELTARSHLKLAVRYLQVRAKAFVPPKGSNHRWLDNAVCSVKQALRERGAVFAGTEAEPDPPPAIEAAFRAELAKVEAPAKSNVIMDALEQSFQEAFGPTAPATLTNLILPEEIAMSEPLLATLEPARPRSPYKQATDKHATRLPPMEKARFAWRHTTGRETLISLCLEYQLSEQAAGTILAAGERGELPIYRPTPAERAQATPLGASPAAARDTRPSLNQVAEFMARIKAAQATLEGLQADGAALGVNVEFLLEYDWK